MIRQRLHTDIFPRFAVLGIALMLGSACTQDAITTTPDAGKLAMPELDAATVRWVATGIYRNETRGQARYLTHWGTGEDFPSLGIGHFIWFPAEVDAPFDESFPGLFSYLSAHANECAAVPDWLENLQSFSAPWSSQVDFVAAQDSAPMLALRQWLAATAPQQAEYIITRFRERWNALELPAADKPAFTRLLQQLLSTPSGLFAVIDYYNFKGLGTNPRERYNGQGWGLLQVLGDVAAQQQPNNTALELVERFSDAAAQRLQNRASAAPAERNEERWLPGWMRRVAEYKLPVESATQARLAGFRVTPYVQNPTPDSMTVIWFSDVGSPGQLTLRANEAAEAFFTSNSTPVLGCALNYHPLELAALDDGRLPTAPYRHEVQLRELEPGSTYRYDVVQNGQHAGGEFRVPAVHDQEVRFVVYADSEAEPESKGKPAAWGGEDDAAGDRPYFVDQDTGYRENLRVMAAARPDFIAIAGDLVQSGGEQRDWDEFWRLNAGVAAGTPILPARGNHEYFGGPGALGDYGNDGTERAIAKYRTYFSLPDSAASDVRHHGAYYALNYGPVTLIVLDSNDGIPHRSASDTNWYLRAGSEGGIAPAWNPGSEQYTWLKAALRAAQQRSRFTFVMFHASPYSSGVHGLPAGFGDGEDYLSGRPLRTLTPLFLQYGVDAVFNGHDELYEHSSVSGQEQGTDGMQQHVVHFFTVGIGGDGLRGPLSTVHNRQRVFSVHEDAPESYDQYGTLIEGGAHYGHLQVTVTHDPEQGWQARLTPVYVLPQVDTTGKVTGFSRRQYADVTVLNESNKSSQ